MPFLPPNQQRQSTEGNIITADKLLCKSNVLAGLPAKAERCQEEAERNLDHMTRGRRHAVGAEMKPKHNSKQESNQLTDDEVHLPQCTSTVNHRRLVINGKKGKGSP